MRPNMSEDKKMEDSSFVIASIEGSLASEPKNSRLYKKHVFIAVSAALALAAILTAILVGMHLFTEAQKDIMRFSYNLDKNTKQDVMGDPNTNILEFHVSSKDYEMWVVNDFNRDIQMMKIHSALGTNCYVTPLNRTAASELSKITPPSGNQMTQNVTRVLTYSLANTPVLDSSFMCEKAKRTCKGISTYWIFPNCEGSEGPGVAGRQKRGGNLIQRGLYGVPASGERPLLIRDVIIPFIRNDLLPFVRDAGLPFARDVVVPVIHDSFQFAVELSKNHSP